MKPPLTPFRRFDAAGPAIYEEGGRIGAAHAESQDLNAASCGGLIVVAVVVASVLRRGQSDVR